VVCVDKSTGDRSFPYWTGMPDPGGPVGSLDHLANAACLLVDGKLIETALPAAREARRLGVPVVGDYENMGEAVRSLLPHTDYAICSEDAARRAGAADDRRAACEAVRRLGAAHVLVTLGARGVAWLDGDELRRMPAFPVDVVDTTGAGDVFHGAFCYGLVAGWGFERGLRFASAAAALSCRRLGGRAGIPTRAEVEGFLEENTHG
jgi:sulfofructose kinase